MASRDGYRQDHEVVFHLDVRALLEERMTIGDEMSNERNREIANDNYYRLKWLLDAGRKFLAKLDEAHAVHATAALTQVLGWAEELRKELNR